jgi:hypothetical protein
MIASVVVIVTLIRLLLGRFSRWEMGLGAVVIVVWIFQEWAMHRYLLHMKPLNLLGKRIYPSFARRHRQHHDKPWVPETMFPRPYSVIRATLLLVMFWIIVTPTPALAATGMGVYSIMALLFEWSHFLSHAAYRPRSRFCSILFASHWHHHFTSERYWYSFTLPFVDSLLGTGPDPKSIAVSPALRALEAVAEARSVFSKTASRSGT